MHPFNLYCNLMPVTQYSLHDADEPALFAAASLLLDQSSKKYPSSILQGHHSNLEIEQSEDRLGEALGKKETCASSKGQT